jgi:hypothetical protein
VTQHTRDTIWRRLWEAWKRFARRVADLQARVLLFVFYYTILAPFGLMVRLFTDPLALSESSPRGWQAHAEREGPPLERARSQA